MSSNVDHKAMATALINEIQRAIKTVPAESLTKIVVDSLSLVRSLIPTTDPGSSSSQNMPGPVGRRSSLEKRKSCGREWSMDGPSPCIDDGYKWKKYGSKNIKNSPHKRNYFRCSFAKDQNCKAKKQVQRTKDDPVSYIFTYQESHVCKAPVSPHLIYDDTTDYSMMMRFDQLDQSMVSDSVPPQPVAVDQQITIGDQATDHTMNLEYTSNEFWVHDNQLWESSENFISLDDLSGFDYMSFCDDD